ncbi:cation diffusion facilitator family transporter [Clostridium sp. BJN0001]|uniref:cation diffusion facilitator family transporter n=1 Tax=Clostridium sp. BJN0001 TaxID=2930219 RepID=UPI001FD240D5|nr:cation diffusion facilitator family transporter [Clostridium sp. BJN0001]
MEQEKNKRKSAYEKEIAMKVSFNSIVVNTILSIFKLLAGIFASSGAMISDAVHSASDVFSTFIVIIGVNIANKKSDNEHQYGHERMECIASIILAAVLLGTGLCIGYQGIKKIIYRNYIDIAIPGILALIAASISIIVKEWMYRYTKNASKKINSSALMADAWHHRSDALSSIGALIGILGSRIGFPILDSVASVVICIFIVKASYDIFKDSVNKLVDKSCDKKIVDSMRKVILNQTGVLRIDDIRTRIFGNKVYVDIEIAADGNKSLIETHKIAESVHHIIENDFGNVKHCMVHVNPYKK